MASLRVGDIVARKSYGGDLFFRIMEIKFAADGTPVYVLKGLEYRIQADSREEDLVRYDPRQVRNNMRKNIDTIKKHEAYLPGFRSLFAKRRSNVGRVLHIDSSSEFLDMCLKYYREAGISATGKVISEEKQPQHVKALLQVYKPELLVLTGHDSMKKGNIDRLSLSSYSNSRYYTESVRRAREYAPDFDSLYIFAGACQSYYEKIMEAGANFASSPERVLIHALDPAMATEKVALTDSRVILRPADVINATKTGAPGIGGIETRGRTKK